MKRTTEAAFETVIEAHVLENGYGSVAGEGFDRERAIFPEMVLTFIRETQPKEWAKLEALHGDRTGDQILGDLCKWMDVHGSLATLRHGFKCYGRTLRAAYFKAAHELNPELESRYAANRLGITRQLHYSPRSENSVDVTLSLNGIPVATVELKNPLTGQRVEHARRQYREDRDPREPIFEFKRRTLVHFGVDTDSVLMTTRLAGAATRFLPFNKGCAGAAGNPPDPAGRNYRTAYLWEEVLQRDSLLDLLARFIHLQIDEKRDDRGRKVKVETMIFPRYHQLEAVRIRVDSARNEGAGQNYLVEHSAGSGKSNTIGWLSHRLASLHDAANERVFDSVIVVTDRVVLDQQLQDTIYQFEHKRGVVQRIDASSRQLAEALENAVPVIITTLQKFPFVSRQLLKMAEERGTDGTGTLATRRCAVIVDEAHSSQGGETATDLKEVLGGERLREEAKMRAAEEGRENMEELFRSMAKRGKQANLSFFAFTATPKHKTFAVFGRDGRPAHRYTIAQFLSPHRYDGVTGRYHLSEKPTEAGARTVIIDEASMLTEEMLAALIQGLKGVHRLILIGDPRQLPPIGAGRPFVDIVKHLAPEGVTEKFPRVGPSYAELTVRRRQAGEEREDLQLAEWFSGSPIAAGEDDVFDKVVSAGQSTHVRFVQWETPEDLRSRLIDVLVSELKLPDGTPALTGTDDIAGFDATLGGEAWKDMRFFNARRGDKAGAAEIAEGWQILSPVRSAAYGVPDLNRLIHKQFRQAMIDAARKEAWQRKYPKAASSGPSSVA